MARRTRAPKVTASHPVAAEELALLPIKRETVTQQATDALRERIIRGAYPDGTPLRQDAIAGELGISRIPVREALRRLEAEGLVVFNPHRGAVVSSLSIAEIKELFELRAQIETGLVRRAVSRMTGEDIAKAREILRSCDVALRNGTAVDWGKLNWDFHSTLYAPANRPFTMAIIHRLHQRSDRYFRMLIVLTHGESRASSEHKAILEAVVARNGAEVASLLRQHVLGSGRQLVDYLRVERKGTAVRDEAGLQ